jgi:hypothetical protein
MTPGERQYDIDLAKSMRDMAKWVQARSGKISQTLLAGAERIDALSSAAPIVTPQDIQPASTGSSTLLEPVRD